MEDRGKEQVFTALRNERSGRLGGKRHIARLLFDRGWFRIRTGSQEPVRIPQGAAACACLCAAAVYIALLPNCYRLSALSCPRVPASVRRNEEPREATTPRGSWVLVAAQCLGWALVS